MAKRFSHRGISKHRSYTLEEAGIIIGASKQTLRKHSKEKGLKVMDSQKPIIVHGKELIRHLKSLEPVNPPPLKAGEFACWSCHERHIALGQMADYFEFTHNRGRLAALCGGCEKSVSRFVGKSSLAEYSTVLEILYR